MNPLQYGCHLPHAHTFAHASNDIQSARGEFAQYTDTLTQSIEFVEQYVDFCQQWVMPLAIDQQCIDYLSMLGQNLLVRGAGCRYVTRLGLPRAVQQQVSSAAHSRDNDHHLISAVPRLLDNTGYLLESIDTSYRGTPKFHYDEHNPSTLRSLT
jgi:hypothetical protein